MTTLDQLTEYLSLLGGVAPVRLAEPTRTESTRALVGGQQTEDVRALLRAGIRAGLIECHIGTIPEPPPGSNRPPESLICRQASRAGIIGEGGLTRRALSEEWLNAWMLLKVARGSVILLTDRGWTQAALSRHERSGSHVKVSPHAHPIPITETTLPKADLDDLFSEPLYYAFSGPEGTPTHEAGTAQRVIYGTTELLLAYEMEAGGPPVYTAAAAHDPHLAEMWQIATCEGASCGDVSCGERTPAHPWRLIPRPTHYAEAEATPKPLRSGTVQLANGQHVRPEVVRFIQDHYPEASWTGTPPEGHPDHDPSCFILIRSGGRIVCLLAPIPRSPRTQDARSIPSVRRMTARELQAMNEPTPSSALSTVHGDSLPALPELTPAAPAE